MKKHHKDGKHHMDGKNHKDGMPYKDGHGYKEKKAHKDGEGRGYDKEMKKIEHDGMKSAKHEKMGSRFGKSIC